MAPSGSGRTCVHDTEVGRDRGASAQSERPRRGRERGRKRPGEKEEFRPIASTAGGAPRQGLGFLELQPRIRDVVEALLRLPPQTLSKQISYLLRRLLRQIAPGRLLRQDRREDVRDGLAFERPLPRQHLEEDAAERPDVRPLVDGLPPCLLGTHVRRRPEDDARRRRARRQRRRVRHGWCRAGAAVCVEDLREAEVEDLRASVRRDLHVRGLEVAVDDPFLVCRLQRLGDLPGVGEGFFEWKRAGQDALGEVVALDELHDQEVARKRRMKKRGFLRMSRERRCPDG